MHRAVLHNRRRREGRETHTRKIGRGCRESEGRGETERRSEKREGRGGKERHRGQGGGDREGRQRRETEGERKK